MRPTVRAHAGAGAGPTRLRWLLHTLIALVLTSTAADAQGVTWSLAPGWLEARDHGSPGLRLDAGYARNTIDPTAWWDARVALTGALAWNPDANPEALLLSGDLGWLRSLSSPGIAPDDPDEPLVGGYNYGSLLISARGGAEADQRLRDVLGSLGLRLAYQVDRQSGLWPLVPWVAIGYSGVVPIREHLPPPGDRGSPLFGRLDTAVEWHPFLPFAPIRLHAALRYWAAHGQTQDPAAPARRDGLHQSYAVALLPSGWRAGRLQMTEVFLRWSGGDLPVPNPGARAWMIGLAISD